MPKYIYQSPQWPHFSWDDKAIQFILGQVRHLQGKILGQMSALGFSLREETMLATLTLDVLKSSEIEGEMLNYQQVRSSIARKLGIEQAAFVHADRNVEGVVEMMLDATQRFNAPLDHERLFGWHAALFPTGWSGMHRIDAGCYRSGEMQVVSGPMGKEKIHYMAPPPHSLTAQMDTFLQWFIIIHPFDDGNGRMARAISDLLLARSEASSQRFYSLSNQILIEKKSTMRYYSKCSTVAATSHLGSIGS